MSGAQLKVVELQVILDSVKLIYNTTSFNFNITCSGQAGAIRLGISRALDIWDKSLRPALRQGNFILNNNIFY